MSAYASTHLAGGWKAQTWIWAALLRAEVASQFGRSGFGLISKLMEPLLHIGVLVLWHWLLRVMPVYGTSIVLFIATGIYPIFIFVHVSSMFQSIARSRRETFRGITDLDLMFVKAVVVVGPYLVAGAMLFSAFYWLVTPQAIPFRPERVMGAVVAAVLLGVGMAFINAMLSTIFKFWHFLWMGLSRSLILFGGVLYVPDFLPTNLRDYMKWNPALQVVELFRQGFYPGYPTLVFMPTYLFGTAITLVALGLCLQRSLRDSEQWMALSAVHGQ